MVVVRAAVITGERGLEWLEVRDPVPAPGGVVVDISRCGICGTDVHAYLRGGTYPPALSGHEWTGTVSAVATGVDALAEGDRVSVAVPAACGTCPECRAGWSEWCSTATMSLAVDPAGSPHGGYAHRFAVSASRLVRVPPGLADDAAAMIEPATVAFHGVRRSGLRLGNLVVVLGADVVIECAGVPATIQTAVDLVRRGGRVALIGLSDLPATIAPTTWLMKEVVVRSFIAYVRSDFEQAIPMMESGRIRTAPPHTSTVPLDDLEGAFGRLADGPRAADVKILVQPS